MARIKPTVIVKLLKMKSNLLRTLKNSWAVVSLKNIGDLIAKPSSFSARLVASNSSRESTTASRFLEMKRKIYYPL